MTIDLLLNILFSQLVLAGIGYLTYLITGFIVLSILTSRPGKNLLKTLIIDVIWSCVPIIVMSLFVFTFPNDLNEIYYVRSNVTYGLLILTTIIMIWHGYKIIMYHKNSIKISKGLSLPIT